MDVSNSKNAKKRGEERQGETRRDTGRKKEKQEETRR